MAKTTAFLVLAIAAALAAPPLAAQSESRIGFVNTAGNTHLTTINVGDKLTVQAGKVLLTQTAAFVYGKSEGVQNANSQLARIRAPSTVGAR